MLALDTSTPTASVAVGRDDTILAEVSTGVEVRQSESLLPAVDFALRSAGLDVDALTGVVVAGGPGSFTGVRIAAATAKGLARGLEIPLFAYSGLLARAAAAMASRQPVCALFDARRGEVYAACYRFPRLARVETVMPPATRQLDEVLERLTGAWGASEAGSAGEVIYVGEGAQRHRERILDAGGLVAPAYVSVPRASALLWLARLDPAGGHVTDPATWEPDYLRGAGAERSVRG